MGKTIALLSVAALLAVVASTAFGADAPPTAPAAKPTVAELMAKAEKGDAVAQFNLGVAFALGEGVGRDPAEAVRLFRKSAEQGLPSAQFNLAVHYAKGAGVPRSTKDAARWYLAAAEQGHASAQYRLGRMYRSGAGVQQDAGEAIRWFRQAADRGVAAAQIILGQMLHTGEGGTQDDRESARRFRQAAEQGVALAQYNVGVGFRVGRGVPKNEIEAIRWYRRAANQGESIAQRTLGRSYWIGRGVPKNSVLAYMWLSLAGSGGDDSANESLREIESEMSRVEIAEAQRLALSFVPKREVPPVSREKGDATSVPDETPVERRRHRGSGTGFSVAEGGYIVTNHHVVAAGTRFQVVSQSGTYEASLILARRDVDIAVLRIQSRLPAIPILPSTVVRLGATVGTIGFPNTTIQGLSPKLSKGEIASLAGAGDDPRYFQISVPVQPGNSGGPLFDERGRVVGVVAAKLREDVARATSGSAPENVNYAIKSSVLLAVLESIPELAGSLPSAADEDPAPSFEDVVVAVEEACVLVLVD